jgi:hypothetical protein
MGNYYGRNVMKGFIVIVSAIACVFFEVMLANAVPAFFEPIVGSSMAVVLGLWAVMWAGFLMVLGLAGSYWLMQGFVKGYVGAR